jgi:hypothetical protein
MGLISKTVKPSEASAINGEGASTDLERDEAIRIHEQEYHPAGEDDSGYLDENSGQYLSYQEYKIPFYLSGNGKKNSYMNYVPQIRSSKVPYKILSEDDFMITKVETYSSDTNSGKLFSVRDKANGYDEIFYIDVGSDPVDEYLAEGLQFVVTNGMELTCRVLGTRVNNPVVILTMRRIIAVQQT